MDKRYSEKILEAIIKEELPWEKGLKITFQEFAKEFTLHDSYWVSIYYNIGLDTTATLIIDWDHVWLPSYVKERLQKEDLLVLLLIKIENVRQISTYGYEHWKEPFRICRVIEYFEIESIDNEFLVVFHDVYGSSVSVIFRGPVCFLSIMQDFSILNLHK